ncbi:MAG: hypothetical protein FWF86_08310 [Clostridia bacterium]|nr:hypothetical protein [Clostridia bacterium]
MRRKQPNVKMMASLTVSLALFMTAGVAVEALTGTGGTRSRTRYFTEEHKEGNNWYDDWDEDLGKHPDLDARGQALLDRWLAENGAHRNWNGWQYVTDELFAVCDGYQEKEFPDDAFGLAGPYTRIYDVNSGAVLTLPEVFYDGFDFYDYINTYLTLLPEGTSINGYYTTWPPSILNFRQPFTLALDASTPFTIFPDHYGQAYVQIVLPDEFYDVYEDDDVIFRDTRYFLFVPLTHDISPWGGCTVDMRYQETETPSGMRLMKPALRIDGGRLLAVEDQINAALDGMLPGVLQALDAALPGLQYLYDDPEASPGWVQAFPSVADHYAAVSYHLMYFDYDIGSFDRVALLAVAAFDLHTGERIADIADLAGNALDRADAVFAKYDFGAETRVEVDRNTLMDHLAPGSIPRFSDLQVRDGELWVSFGIHPYDLERDDPGYFSAIIVPLGIPVQ